MNAERFNEIVEARLAKVRATLVRKRGEYASDDDVLRNFREASRVAGATMAEAALGYMLKHWASVMDLVRRQARGTHVTPELVDEKVGDAINYLILLEAIFEEGFDG